MILTYLFLFDISSNASYIIEYSIIFLVFGAMGVQFIISLYTLSQAFMYAWDKIQKYKAFAFIENSKHMNTISSININEPSAH